VKGGKARHGPVESETKPVKVHELHMGGFTAAMQLCFHKFRKQLHFSKDNEMTKKHVHLDWVFSR